MKIDVVVPAVGESITSGILHVWLKADGEYVKQGEDLFELETEKSTLVVPANGSGVLKILVPAETEIKIGQVVAELDQDAAQKEPVQAPQPQEPGKKMDAAQEPQAAAVAGAEKPLSPAVRRIVAEHHLDAAAIPATGPKANITKEDALRAVTQQEDLRKAQRPSTGSGRTEGAGKQTRVKMSLIRKKIAEHLVQSQHNAAHVTTFNEIDMSAVMAIRSQYKEEFEDAFGVRLGFMSFFVKATQHALAKYPELNAFIEGEEIVYNQAYHIGVALSTDKGLFTPVIRDVEQKSFATIEQEIVTFSQKARDKKLLPQDLTGGTFTITNGGVFGSLLSTPIPNPPQSGILGMHTIQKRPVAVQDEIVLRPMMYVALTYDHRIVDGREGIGFLIHIKRLIEDPSRLLLEL